MSISRNELSAHNKPPVDRSTLTEDDFDTFKPRYGFGGRPSKKAKLGTSWK